MNPDLERRLREIDDEAEAEERNTIGRKKGWVNQRSEKVAEKKGKEVAPTPEQTLFIQAALAHGLPEPVWEYQFHPDRGWKFDYLFGGWLAVEKEGGIYGKGKPCPHCKRRPPGAHSSIERLKSDMEKYNEAHVLGYVVLRFLPEQIESGAAFATIKRALDAEGEMP